MYYDVSTWARIVCASNSLSIFLSANNGVKVMFIVACPFLINYIVGFCPHFLFCNHILNWFIFFLYKHFYIYLQLLSSINPQTKAEGHILFCQNCDYFRRLNALSYIGISDQSWSSCARLALFYIWKRNLAGKEMTQRIHLKSDITPAVYHV